MVNFNRLRKIFLYKKYSCLFGNFDLLLIINNPIVQIKKKLLINQKYQINGIQVKNTLIKKFFLAKSLCRHLFGGEISIIGLKYVDLSNDNIFQHLFDQLNDLLVVGGLYKISVNNNKLIWYFTNFMIDKLLLYYIIEGFSILVRFFFFIYYALIGYLFLFIQQILVFRLLLLIKKIK